MRRRLVAPAAAAAAVLALAAPAAALAASDLQVAVVPADGRFGDRHHVQGTFRDAAGAPLAGREIVIQYRDFPYTGTFRPIAIATTGADGRYAVNDVLLYRNADIRAVADDRTASGIARAWTYPAFTLTYRAAGTSRIKLTQVYSTPSRVRLRAPTLFYLGPASAATGAVRARAKTRRTAPGIFTAVATVKIPNAWKGRFRYASCFAYTEGSGMGDPARGCPARFAF
jgi:hypothetical protein